MTEVSGNGSALATMQVSEIDAESETFIRVYELPHKLTGGYCFGSGVPVTFTNVDWFNCLISEGRAGLEKYIRTKRYIKPGRQYLVIGDRADFTFRFET